MNSEYGKPGAKGEHSDSFVLDKSIFSSVFERDIRRVYIYKKSERLAKALQLVSPAFHSAPALRTRADTISIALIDASVLPIARAREQLSRELLALSSLLSMARAGSLLSPMNADMIAHEAHQLLEEVSQYEEPRLSFEDAPTLAALAKDLALEGKREQTPKLTPHPHIAGPLSISRLTPTTRAKPVLTNKGQAKGQASAVQEKKGNRREAILAVLRTKDSVYIKDVSTVLRDVSEKTVQRELQSLVEEGLVHKSGERRWTTYALA